MPCARAAPGPVNLQGQRTEQESDRFLFMYHSYLELACQRAVRRDPSGQCAAFTMCECVAVYSCILNPVSKLRCICMPTPLPGRLAHVAWDGSQCAQWECGTAGLDKRLRMIMI